MQPRTKRQREIFDYLSSFIEERGYEPSYQQIARHFHIASKSAVAKHIAALERQGLILRVRETGSFNLQVRPKNSVDDAVCRIDWLDVSNTGVFGEEWEESALFVPKFLLRSVAPERVCAFRVRNDSMIEQHICEGDIALIEQRSFARDGDCVVAVVEKHKIALKRFYRDGSHIELRPANKDYAVLRLPAEKIVVKGVFRALLRPLG